MDLIWVHKEKQLGFIIDVNWHLNQLLEYRDLEKNCEQMKKLNLTYLTYSHLYPLVRWSKQLWIAMDLYNSGPKRSPKFHFLDKVFFNKLSQG